MFVHVHNHIKKASLNHSLYSASIGTCYGTFFVRLWLT